MIARKTSQLIVERLDDKNLFYRTSPNVKEGFPQEWREAFLSYFYHPIAIKINPKAGADLLSVQTISDLIHMFFVGTNCKSA